jgi:flavin reductase (DIM6/NTAB) family NADH-FMN oxidoreductase RutF
MAIALTAINPRHFRDVMGCHPTGVCVVTAAANDGARFGMVVGSFTSISLDPPLVGFFPDKKSDRKSTRLNSSH